MKSLMSLWREVADELATWCCTSATLDYKKLERRVKAEGVSFLTISLPSYARDFERSLDAGSIDPGSFSAFKRRNGLPLFLGGFLDRIFDSSGVLLNEPCVDSILAIRQLTLMFKRIELPCSDAREARAIAGFVAVEEELTQRRDSRSTPADLLRKFQRTALLLWGDAFQTVDRKVEAMELRPRHGPGRTQDKLLGNQKWNFVEWTDRLEKAGLHYVEYGLPRRGYYDHQDFVEFLEPGRERPVKVTLVPKTLKTPRIIAIEPTCMQYMQQGISSALIQEIEKPVPLDSINQNLIEKVGVPALGFVGFESQDENRSMAREGSLNGELATLDLSEASDRVLNGHVELLFEWWPSLSEAVQASRSTKARLPGFVGDKVSYRHSNLVLDLAKFASMGSALCFPVEALVFSTIVFTAIADELRAPLTWKVLNSFRGRVRVYGDDIIVPVEFVPRVIRYLEAFGLKVNADKSFWTGKFRESCGGDYYDGNWVTPVKVGRKFPSTLDDVDEVSSLVSLRNQFYWAGMWKTAAYLDNVITKIFRGHFPIVEGTSSALGRESVLPYRAEKTCTKLHRPLVRAWQRFDRVPANPLDEIGALLKCLSKASEEPFEDPKHLLRSGPAERSSINLRWSAPF